MIKFQLKKANYEVKSQGELSSKLENQFSDFAPGSYETAITKAGWHLKDVNDPNSARCQGDNTWFNLKVELTAVDGRKLNTFIQVPTEKLTYGEKKTYAVFKKFSEFMAGVGFPVNLDNLDKVAPKVFADPEKSLKGKTVTVDLGFEGARVEKCDDGFKIVQANGKDLLDESGELYVLPDRKSAVSTAESMKIRVGFIQVLKYHPGKPAKTQEPETQQEAPESDGWD
jgi:hypothetical protein